MNLQVEARCVCMCMCVCGSMCVCVLSCSDSLQPYGLQPSRLVCSWDFPGKNTRVGCRFLLQGIFQTQGLTHISCVSSISAKFFNTELPGKPQLIASETLKEKDQISDFFKVLKICKIDIWVERRKCYYRVDFLVQMKITTRIQTPKTEIKLFGHKKPLTESLL